LSKESDIEILERLDSAPKMVVEKLCPVCNIPMWLKDVIVWGKSHKFDKQFKCHKCSLNLVEKAVEE
jgi:superfamily II helicase